MFVNEKIETRSFEERDAAQGRQLQAIIERAYKKTTFYQDRLHALQLTPESFQTIRDFARLPFLTDADLIANHPFGLLTLPLSGIARLQARKDGQSAVALTQDDLTNQLEMIARGLISCNVTRSSVLLLLADELELALVSAVQQAAEAIGATVIVSQHASVKTSIKQIFDYGVTTLFSAPSSMLKLADCLRELGFDAHELSLLNLFSPALLCPPNLRQTLEQDFQAPLYEMYGAESLLPCGIASACHAQAGLHVQDDHFYPEIVNFSSGSLCAPGERGELVLTTLSREGAPLLRYRTGTEASLDLPPCSCGRTTPRLHF
ncbi:phenylacetate--CoA ligase family protein [Azotosporobacter soli]|uniref:phenylacetate--CoA ligase family protein n=1 Tax=Azotosporobacter soli TaxID=3055040 RepID=UPI0031FF180D